MKAIINTKRLRDYPRLMFITVWTILAINVIFRNGWLGLVKQIIGSDFITLYAAGLSYRTDIAHLYDLNSQAAIQQALITPTVLPGVNPFISPPYVAAAYSLFTFIKLPVAFILWTALTIIFTVVSVRNLVRLLPESVSQELGFWQLFIIILSFFPFVEGLQVGQNHALTLMLVALSITFSLNERWFLAGTMSGLLLYKPQLVLGLALIWLIWRKYKALAGLALIALVWAGSILVIDGFAPYMTYLSASREFVLLPYIQGFPGYLLLTLYGLLATILPIQSLRIVDTINLIVSGVLLIGLVWLAYRSRNAPILERTPVIVLALLLPIVATPYALLHDLVILIPGFILWARYDKSRVLLYCAIAVYLASFFLPLLASTTKIALMSLITLGLVTSIFIWTYLQKRTLFWNFNR